VVQVAASFPGGKGGLKAGPEEKGLALPCLTGLSGRLPRKAVTMFQSLRKRIEKSELGPRILGAIIAWWVKFCLHTTRWERRGDAEIEAALAEGPVQVVLWHEHIMLAAAHWPRRWGPVAILTDVSPAARLAGAVQSHFGMRAFTMSSKLSNLAASRELIRLVQSGVTLGGAADGPRGPARVMKDAPLDWARVAGRPIVLYAYAMRRQFRLNSWDRMIVPLPFSRGVCLYRRFDAEVPRRAESEQLERLKVEITEALDLVLVEVESAMGRETKA
jgi:lysophospholipid acyltransferase (LPLAT)-like uncharacterized protein